MTHERDFKDVIERARQSRDYRGLATLATELYSINTIEAVLDGACAASASYGMHHSDSLFATSAKIAEGIDPVFSTEVDRYFRQHEISGEFGSAFVGRVGRGERRHLDYVRSNVVALLVGGKSSERDVRRFRDFLVSLGIKRGYTLNWNSEPENFAINYSRAFSKVNDPYKNVVIFNSSCGYDGGVLVAEDDGTLISISYKELFKHLRGHKGNVVFVNAACVGTSAEIPLTELGLLPERMLLLTSGEHFTQPMYMEQLIKDYSEGRVWAPEPISGKLVKGILHFQGRGQEITDVNFQAQSETDVTANPKRIGANHDYLLINFDARN